MLYRVDDQLGDGRHGAVHRGRPERVGARPVAVRHLILDDVAFVRLRRHAEMLALVAHPNLGLIEDVSRCRDGSTLVATTLGTETVADRLARGLVDVDEALDVIEVVACALAAAHRAALPHGAVHPGNVVWSVEEPHRPLLVDLGLAAVVASDPDAETPVGVWRRDRADLVALARAIAARVAPTSARSSALVRLVSDADDDIVHGEAGLVALADGCARIRRHSDLPPLHVATADEPQPLPARPRRDAGRHLVAAGALVAGCVVGLGAVAGGDDVAVSLAPVDCGGPPGAPPAGAEPVAGIADRDGDGCRDAVWWSSDDAVLHVGEATGVSRFRAGNAGDQALLGDWDCDGSQTVGLYRPETGETFLFSDWARSDGVLEAEVGPTVAANSTARVFSDDGCDELTAGSAP